jgi:hypothetical protein
MIFFSFILTHARTPTSYKQQMMYYEPCRRVSAKGAMRHPYFNDLDKAALD